MSEKLLSKDLFKNYSKYCLPILFFILILLVVLLISFNNLATTVITTVTDVSIGQISQIRYDFVGVQLLNFTTFLLACVLPIVVALIMGTYEKSSKSKKEEISIEHNELFSNRLVAGSLYIVLPFLANAFIYIMLVWTNYFGTMQSEILIKLLMMTIFGIALSLLTFMLMTIINMALKNATIDALLTLAIVLFVVHVFYYMPINPIFLIAIIVFVWLALIYLGYSLGNKNKNK